MPLSADNDVPVELQSSPETTMVNTRDDSDMRSKAVNFVNDSRVARFLTGVINSSPKLQVEIARDIGFEKPNMITMIKQGRTKLPISKVLPVADSLDLDARELLTLCMQEYQPEEWAVIREVFEI